MKTCFIFGHAWFIQACWCACGLQHADHHAAWRSLHRLFPSCQPCPLWFLLHFCLSEVLGGEKFQFSVSSLRGEDAVSGAHFSRLAQSCSAHQQVSAHHPALHGHQEQRVLSPRPDNVLWNSAEGLANLLGSGSFPCLKHLKPFCKRLLTTGPEGTCDNKW